MNGGERKREREKQVHHNQMDGGERKRERGGREEERSMEEREK